jgi:hypothetical protein
MMNYSLLSKNLVVRGVAHAEGRQGPCDALRAIRPRLEQVHSGNCTRLPSRDPTTNVGPASLQRAKRATARGVKYGKR